MHECMREQCEKREKEIVRTNILGREWSGFEWSVSADRPSFFAAAMLKNVSPYVISRALQRRMSSLSLIKLSCKFIKIYLISIVFWLIEYVEIKYFENISCGNEQKHKR